MVRVELPQHGAFPQRPPLRCGRAGVFYNGFRGAELPVASAPCSPGIASCPIQGPCCASARRLAQFVPRYFPLASVPPSAAYMRFFGDAQTDNTPSAMPNQTNAVQAQVTLVGEGTVFEGTLQVEDDFRAHGRIIGTLEVEGKAMIAEQGAVEGDLIAANAEIAGQVQGEIHVEERLVLKSTARVDGKIDTARLVIEEGAQFTGECEMETPISGRVDAASEEEQENGDMSRTERSATGAESSGEDISEEVAMA